MYTIEELRKLKKAFARCVADSISESIKHAESSSLFHAASMDVQRLDTRTMSESEGTESTALDIRVDVESLL